MLEALLLFYSFVVGSCIGSFLNVIVDRTHAGKSLMGRSTCDSCSKTLTAFDLIPIVSYVALRAKCRSCSKSFSPQYLLVELATAVTFTSVTAFVISPVYPLASLMFPTILQLLLLWTLASMLIVITLADLRYMLIPDRFQIVFLVLCVLYRIINPVQFSIYNFGNYMNIFLDGLLVAAPLLFIFLATKARGLGFADVKLGFSMGICLGVILGWFSLWAAFAAGALYGICILALRKAQLKSRLPFAPFMVLGFTVSLIFSLHITSILRYWGML